MSQTDLLDLQTFLIFSLSKHSSIPQPFTATTASGAPSWNNSMVAHLTVVHCSALLLKARLRSFYSAYLLLGEAELIHYLKTLKLEDSVTNIPNIPTGFYQWLPEVHLAVLHGTKNELCPVLKSSFIKAMNTQGDRSLQLPDKGSLRRWGVKSSCQPYDSSPHQIPGAKTISQLGCVGKDRALGVKMEKRM